jgi:cell division protease FtsH
MPEPNDQAPATEPRAPEPSADQPPSRPWRTEGLPKGEPAPKGPRWSVLALLAIGYLIVFGILTVQDRLSGPEAIPYTEFKAQVASRNVGELFARGDSIQGGLKKGVPVPGEPARTYERFTTERPTFASDDLLAELTAGGATVRATPLVQERGILTNLIISVAPFLLLIAFYVWIFRRQKNLMGGGILGAGPRKPVDKETVRVTFDDVAGIDEVEGGSRDRRLLRNPESTGVWAPARRKACC